MLADAHAQDSAERNAALGEGRGSGEIGINLLSEDDIKEISSKLDGLNSALARIADEVRDFGPREDQTERDEARQVRDLQAQETMALASLWAAVASGVAAACTALGLWLLRGTLIHSRTAAHAAQATVEEAKRATAAAEQAVEETRSIGRAQVRAYLGIVSCVLKSGPSNNFILATTVKNSGQSPATDIEVGFRVYASARYDFNGQIRHVGFPLECRGQFHSRRQYGFLAAGADRCTELTLVPEAASMQIFTSSEYSQIRFSVMIDLIYRDVFHAKLSSGHNWIGATNMPIVDGHLIETSASENPIADYKPEWSGDM